MPLMPGPITDERAGLLGFLEQQRQQLKNTTYGLTDEQAALTPTASALSVGGLVKHAASVERNWTANVLGVAQPQADFAAYFASFRFEPTDTLEALLKDYDAAAQDSDELFASIDDLGRFVPKPPNAPWIPAEIEGWSVRWVLLHMIEETARHAGHADVIRESIDGAQAGSLMAAAEHWPADGFIKPWTPSG
ncbi:MAG TPA: DinB family protein [Mycobacteriales bacterium]|nr:DinB family protein [Mycobacteriales bacterium]